MNALATWRAEGTWLVATLLLALLLTPVPGQAQSLLSARIGGGFGVSNPVTLGLELSVPVRPRLRALASVEAYGPAGPCLQLWPGSFRCAYDGVLTEVGAAISAVRTTRLYLDVTAAGGLFARTSYGDHPATMLGGSIGAGAGFRAAGRVWLEGSLRGVGLRDRMYRQLFGVYPRLGVVAVGVGVSL